MRKTLHNELILETFTPSKLKKKERKKNRMEVLSYPFGKIGVFRGTCLSNARVGYIYLFIFLAANLQREICLRVLWDDVRLLLSSSTLPSTPRQAVTAGVV